MFNSEWTWRIMGSALGVVLCLAIVFSCGVLLSLPVPHGVREYPSSVPVLQEDDPGWDCHTMGNLRCGPRD